MTTRTKKTKEKFPGYPHYPSTEDITQNEKPLDADVENLSASFGGKKDKLKERKPVENTKDETPEIVGGTQADLTYDDMMALGAKDRDLDEGEDELLLSKLELGPDFSGDDLDVPGSELDDDQEDIGSEDEENNFYSRGQA